MKLTIERGALLQSLAHVQSIVEKRNTIPILSNVLLEAADGALALTATDLDVTIVERTPAAVTTPGAATVGAHTLYDIVRKLPEGAQAQIESQAESGQAVLRAGRSRFTLSTLPREDFPAMSSNEWPHRFDVAAKDLRNLIDRTRFAISMEETRYYLNGIYIHATRSGDIGVLRAVATDGHRLARFEMPVPAGAEAMPGVIVPRKTVGELHKLIEATDARIEVALSENRIRFAFGDVILTSKLIDGSFPDYQRVIPVGNDKVLEADRASFTAAVDRVSTISSEKTRAVKLAIGPGTLTLSANSPETGSATEELEVRYAGPELEIGFNARYLLDIMQQIEGEGAQFSFADAAAPALVRDVADASALYVIMPMRV